MSDIKREVAGLNAEIHLLEQAPLFDISSTELRNAAATFGCKRTTRNN